MVRNMGVAQDLGYLKVPDNLIVPLKQLEKMAPNKVALVCTGSQGEPMAALSRMANREHVIRVGEGDTVLMASSVIPGNENAISGVINGLTPSMTPRRSTACSAASGGSSRARAAVFEGQNPYRGLELFDVEHAPLFFGREALTEWLLDALRRKPSGAENRFLAIVGASGSGKSSLARAGLLAALKDGKLDGSAAWPRAICRPGAEPFFNLANALKGVAHESDRAGLRPPPGPP